MLFVSLTDFQSTDEIPVGVDGIELRLDLFLSLDFLSDFLCTCRLPVLLTLRRTPNRSESQREALIRRLFLLKPSFFDLESDMRPEFLRWAFSQGIKIILSYHNFEQTPVDLDTIYCSMKEFPAYTYKMAMHSNSSSDALRLLLFARSNPNVNAICMGQRGEFARILGPIVGNKIDFGFLDQPTAPGQLSIRELIETYRYKRLNRKTVLYGLMGNPVHASLGHLFHNEAFERSDINAVYVKMVVEEGELVSFLPLAKQMGFRGLSVTMPLKERVLPGHGAINTLFFDELLTGLSVDGSSTLDAIGDVSNLKIVIIGAGGSARSIVAEAVKRGASVTILNRTIEKAAILAAEYDCKCAPLCQVPTNYDVLINCTPCSMPIASQGILKNTVVADLVYSTKLTPFLQAAELRGCRLVYGQTIFENQAKAQFALWKSR
jgi:3-dehydroquinate dehydratase/shikimate dehydrogenase